jgi:hypothetical protein
MDFYNHGSPVSNYSYSIYYNAFDGCYCLDEIKGLPFPHYNAAWTSNAFSYTFGDCYRLKEMTFAVQEDGTPYSVNWKSQTIDLATNVGQGFIYNFNKIWDYNTDITKDKEVKDDATYQALKDDPDWFTYDLNYSRYNHDSAVNTINSLPYTNGSCTIKFKGDAGALTDGGAINTLTAEEIAVAAAKGWTVTLS